LIQFVKNSFLDELTKIGESEPKTGFVGPKIYFYEFNQKHNIIQYAGAKQNSWKFLPTPIGFKEEDLGQYDLNKKSTSYMDHVCWLKLK